MSKTLRVLYCCGISDSANMSKMLRILYGCKTTFCKHEALYGSMIYTALCSTHTVYGQYMGSIWAAHIQYMNDISTVFGGVEMNDNNEIHRIGRMRKGMKTEVRDYLQSLEADHAIFHKDILVDMAHVVMLTEQEILSADDTKSILSALRDLQNGGLQQINLYEYEDVHIAIETHVTAAAGDAGGKMHTARSRNDEVATCIRMVLRDRMIAVMGGINGLRLKLLNLAAEHLNTIMPGYTHLQHAQPTTLAHNLTAHAGALSRDHERSYDAYRRLTLCPLGAGAFASTSYPIDRRRTAELLGFSGLVENSMDAVSTRDFLVEACSIMSMIMLNLSSICEEIILWSTSEYGFIELDDSYASTSSMMPQKKNPDAAEMVCARCSTVQGCMSSVMGILSALPYSYNRTLQEATPHTLNAADIAISSVKLVGGMIETMKVNAEVMREAAEEGFTVATDLADVIVQNTGLPFRKVHSIVGRIAQEGNYSPDIGELDRVARDIIGETLSGMGLNDKHILSALSVEGTVNRRSITGGPAPTETLRMIEVMLGRIKIDDELLYELVVNLDSTADALDTAVESYL